MQHLSRDKHLKTIHTTFPCDIKMHLCDVCISNASPVSSSNHGSAEYVQSNQTNRVTLLPSNMEKEANEMNKDDSSESDSTTRDCITKMHLNNS